MIQTHPSVNDHYQEVNFDGLVGPTHHYAGLAWGNIASQKHALESANPKAAARQGLAKMWALHQLGIPQGILPPKPCPDLSLLKSVGFSGSNAQLLEQTYQQAPQLLSAVYSSASMWAANAATVTPSCDTYDGKVHFTPANLATQFHRTLETQHTAKLLQTIFNDQRYFVHHAPLPTHPLFADEGAANHTRLCSSNNQHPLHLFVYGQDHHHPHSSQITRYPTRQSKQACEAIIRLHQLEPKHSILIQQNPAAINQGVFHNDVISVGNQNVLLYHQQAFINTAQLIEAVNAHFNELPFYFIEVTEAQVSLSAAIESYLFNSQLITLKSGRMALIAPTECQSHPRVSALLTELISKDGPIQQVHYLNLKQSMKNGGGPACLRLRVILSQQEINAITPNYWLTEDNYPQLCQWVDHHYRDRLSVDDFRDPLFLLEVQDALQALAELMTTKATKQ